MSQAARKEDELTMTADPVLGAADKDEDGGFRITSRRVKDARQSVSTALEDEGAFGRVRVLTHAVTE